jgi:hypothetical protein
MKLVLKIMVVLAMTYPSFVTPTYARAPTRTLQEYSVPELVAHFASQYSVSEKQMLATMKCESSLNPKAIGDHNTSFGISQIHLPAHPDVTKEQAFDPVFASEFMAKNFAQGNQKAWTCWRLLYSV